MLVNVFAHLIATFSLFPILSFILILCAVYWTTKDKRLALHWSINVTTLFLLISVGMTVQYLWEMSVYWLLVTIILFVGVALSYVQFLIRGKICPSRLINGLIKLTFLLFAPVHVLLYIWVVIRAMIQSAT